MKKPLFGTVCIVGVGLIGGSMGIDIRKRGLASHVRGVFRNEDNLRIAVEKGAVDGGSTDIKKEVSAADLIILAGPIYAIIDHIRAIHPYAKADALVIDTGSTKVEIMREASKYFNQPGKAKFIGCHPMAGSEARGVANAVSSLFEKALCLIVPPGDLLILSLWEALGSRIELIEARSHDRAVAWVSHLPHLISFSMFKPFSELENFPIPNKSLIEFARLAKSDPDVWVEIFKSNKGELLSDLNKFIEDLKEWKSNLESDKFDVIRQDIFQANQASPYYEWKLPKDGV